MEDINLLTNKKLNDLKTTDSIEFFLGFISLSIYSKDIFKKNKDIEVFLKEVFDIEFREYILKSRTLIVARLSRLIYSLASNNNYNIPLALQNDIYKYFSEIQRNIKLDNKLEPIKPIKSKKGNTTTESISKWLKGLRGE